MDGGRQQVDDVFGPVEVGEIDEVDPEKAIPYAAMDAEVTYLILPILYKRIKDLKLDTALSIDLNIIPYVIDMKKAGIRINRSHFVAIKTELTAKMDDIGQFINTIAGYEINVGSTKQCAQLLYELEVYKKPDMSTDESHLEAVKDSHPVVGMILEHRKYSKLISTYTDKLLNSADEDDRIHTEWLITRTKTGRLASRDPNLQNIPIRTEDGRRIREGFIPAEDCIFLGADYSQIELRCAAHMAQDENMIAQFLSEEDIHTQTALELWGSEEYRRRAKTANFGILYGLTGYGMSKRTGWSEEECNNIIRDWLALYTGIAEWRKTQLEYARRYGYVRNMFDRIRYVPEVYSTVRRIREEGFKYTINSPVQSSAGDILKIAMADLVPVYRAWVASDSVCNPVLQIHDELVFEVGLDIVDIFKMQLQDIMQNCVEMSVPLQVDIHKGMNWKELK